MAFVRTLLIIVTLIAGWAVLRGGVSAHLMSQLGHNLTTAIR